MPKTKTTKNIKSKESSKTKKTSRVLPIIQGLAMLFIILSISFSSYLVIMGTNDVLPKALIAPQVIFAGYQLVKKFISTK